MKKDYMALTEKNLSIVSRIGGRKENQDNAIVHTSQYGTILIVCDGAGGYNGGNYASAFVCQYIVAHFKQYNGQIDIKDFLLTVITNANIELLNIAAGDPEKEGMKTTLAMAFIKDSNAILFHVGDSRVYHFKLGQLAYRTEDHSYVNELLLQKRITKKEAENHPKSNVITNAMGVHPSSFRVEVKDLDVSSSDLLLLTTDGCHGLISQSKLESMVRKYADLEELCKKICDYCEMQGQQLKRGMYDNLTIIAYSENYRFWPVPVKKVTITSLLTLIVIFVSVVAMKPIYESPIENVILANKYDEDYVYNDNSIDTLITYGKNIKNPGGIFANRPFVLEMRHKPPSPDIKLKYYINDKEVCKGLPNGKCTASIEKVGKAKLQICNESLNHCDTLWVNIIEYKNPKVETQSNNAIVPSSTLTSTLNQVAPASTILSQQTSTVTSSSN